MGKKLDELQEIFDPAIIWVKRITKIIWFFCMIQGILVFSCFIAEESLQSLGFGTFILISNDCWFEARADIEKTEHLFRSIVMYLKATSKFNLYNGKAFRFYVRAEEAKREQMKKTIDQSLTGHGIRALDKANEHSYHVLVTKNGNCFFPIWKQAPYQMESITLFEARRRGYRPSKDWREI